jgi:N6-adenosine-specific RNA methylase IME4
MKYATLVIDPPWRYGPGTLPPSTHGGRTAEDNYPTMTNRDILALPVGDLAADDAHLYLWVTNPRLYGERDDDSINPNDLMKAWGFVYKTCLTWVKRQVGLGFYFRGKTEHVLFGVRGRLPVPPSNRRPNVFETECDGDGLAFVAPRGPGGHSSKPDVFYDLVEATSPGPYLELFARRQRLGWATWGNEAFQDVAL